MPATYNIYNSNLHFRNNAEQPNPVGQDSWGTTTATDHQQRPSSKPWQMPLRAQTVTSKPWRHPVQQSSATQGSWAPAATWETPPATNWEQRPTSQPWRNPAQNNSNSNANKGPWSMPQNAGIVEHAVNHDAWDQAGFPSPAEVLSQISRHHQHHQPSGWVSWTEPVANETAIAAMRYGEAPPLYRSTLASPAAGHGMNRSNGGGAQRGIWANGASKRLQPVPEVPTGNSIHYCRELDGTWRERTTNDIMNNCQPGDWRKHPHTGYAFFERKA